MNFKTNFSKLNLLGNNLVKIYFEDKVVEFVPPNIRLYLMDIDFTDFMILIKQDVKTFNEVVKQSDFLVNTNYDIILTIIKADYKTDILIKYFKILFPNLEYKDSQFKFQDKPLTADEYDTLIQFILVSCAEKDFNEFIKTLEVNQLPSSEDKKVEDNNKRMKEFQDRIDKIKNKTKNKKEEKNNPGSQITIDQIVIAILYEFSSLRLEDIYNMNMFTLLEFWKYVSEVVDTQIQIVAAGNGNIKKFTYFIN